METRTYSYDFADHVVGEVHQANFGGVAVNKVTSRTFDHQGRQKTEAVSINGGPAQEVCQLNYNYKSLITERNLGRFAPSGDRQFLQSIDYAYNNQNWLIKINNARSGNLLEFDYCGMEPGGESLIPMFPQSLSIITDDDLDLFYQEINYDQTIPAAGITPHKNGNISTIKWHGPMKYDQVFTYDYDFLNRLSDVRHGELTNSGSTYTTKNHYDEDFSYDIRGNILTSNRKGLVKQAEIGPMCFEPQTIDSLAYSYHPGTNRLKQVVDYAPCESVLQLPDTIFRDVIYAAPQITVDQTAIECDTELHLEVGTNANIVNEFLFLSGCDSTKVYVRQSPCPQAKFTEGFNQQSDTGEYVYDDSGNLVFDPNKKLSFAYNHLNLPYLVMGKSDTLFYDYAADGSLISEKYKNKQGLVKERQYLRGVELVNGQLEFLPHGEGRILNDGGTWRYEYTLKDHLGNSRFVVCDKDSDGTIEQTMDALTNELLSERHYYSFGIELGGVWQTKVSNLPKNDYAYSGKQMVEEMGWDVLRLGARDYDPALARFITVDPVSISRNWLSSYNYVQNSPLNLIDPTGRLDSTYHINFATGETRTLNDAGGTAINTYIIDNGLPIVDNNYQGTTITVNTNQNGPPNFNIATGAANVTDSPLELIIEASFSAAKIAGVSLITLVRNNIDEVGEAGLKYATGSYKNLRALSKGTGLDAHHVGQQALMKKFVTNYDPKTAPSILVPKHGHTLGTGVVTRGMQNISGARQLLARDIMELRRVYPDIPNDVLKTVIDMNKSMYPSAFKK